MPKLTQEQIRDRGCEIVAGEKDGIRYSALVARISKESPETPVNTIHGSVYDLDQKRPLKVAKPSRGLFVAIPPGGAPPVPPVVPPVHQPLIPPNPKEKQFYEGFAQWLKGDLEEVTEAHVLGGKVMKNRWGTPDVLGVYRSRKRDFVQFSPEIVSAEIKTDPSRSVEAFGQAAAYRLFSSKTYLVMPRTLADDEKDRLDALAMLFGIGLVYFDPADPDRPNFTIQTRAQRAAPDAFFVNEFAKRLHEHDEGLFEKLFG